MAQTALTLALLVGAGLLIRTMVNLSAVAAGYDGSHILSMTVTAVPPSCGPNHSWCPAKSAWKREIASMWIVSRRRAGMAMGLIDTPP